MVARKVIEVPWFIGMWLLNNAIDYAVRGIKNLAEEEPKKEEKKQSSGWFG